jgi:hypothetical protein
VALERRFTVEGANVLLDRKIIYSVSGSHSPLELMFVSIYKDYNTVLLHVRVPVTDEFYETLLLCDVSGGTASEVSTSAGLLEK